MKQYRLYPDRLKRKIYIYESGFFGKTKLHTFEQSQYQDAMECIKKLGASHRPSRVTTFDGQGNLRRQWEYKAKAQPRAYETKPRKSK